MQLDDLVLALPSRRKRGALNRREWFEWHVMSVDDTDLRVLAKEATAHLRVRYLAIAANLPFYMGCRSLFPTHWDLAAEAVILEARRRWPADYPTIDRYNGPL